MENRKKILTDWLFPHDIKCIVCGNELRRDTRYGLCDSCVLKPIENRCSICGREVPAQNAVCDDCREERVAFDGARSCFTYQDDVSVLVWRLKYRNARYLAPYMAEFMTDTFLQTDWHPDLITVVPLHKSRRKLRGYNQAQLLADEVGRRVGLPVRSLLEKTSKTKNLAKLTKKERAEAIQGSFTLCADADVHQKSVLLIDDVLTTGATSGECTKTLKAGGAREVWVLTFASVPHKSLLLGAKEEKKQKKSREKKITAPREKS